MELVLSPRTAREHFGVGLWGYVRVCMCLLLDLCPASPDRPPQFLLTLLTTLQAPAECQCGFCLGCYAHNGSMMVQQSLGPFMSVDHKFH